MRRFGVMAAAVWLMGAGPAPTVEDLAWLAGDRVHVGERSTAREVWIGPEGGVLLGMNLTARPGRPAEYEHIRIAALPDGRLAFFANPSGQAQAVFPLKSLDGRKAVFEDPAHDFPQRVIYWDKGDGVIGARIEGVIGGQARSMEWEFRGSAAPKR